MDLAEELNRLHTHVLDVSDIHIQRLHSELYRTKRYLFHRELAVDTDAFNGQFSKHQIWKDIRNLLSGSLAVETGTYHGGTARFLSKFFSQVITIEADAAMHRIAVSNSDCDNIEYVLSDSAVYFRECLSGSDLLPEFFYLDAHWRQDCPLKIELAHVFSRFPDALVMVDDMEVPGDRGYGFDKYENFALKADYLLAEINEFGLSWFVPTMLSEIDSVASQPIEPRGTWIVAKSRLLIDKLCKIDSLRRG